MSLNNKREEAKNEFSLGNYEKSKALFQDLYQGTKDQWDGWGLARSLNKLGNYAEAEEVSKEVYDSFSDFKYIKSTYTMSLFMNRMRKNSPNYNSADSERTFELIFNCESGDNRFWTSPAFKSMLASFKENNQNEKIAKWYDKIDINLLNNESKKIGDVEYSSDRDACFLIFIRAFLGMQQWSKCVEVCDIALNTAQTNLFSSNKNTFWYKRGKAIALSHKGEHDTSISLFEDLLKQKQDWYLYNEIAAAYKLKGDRSNERDYLINGCLSSKRQPKIGMLWNMFYALGLNLLETDNQEYGKLHLQLAFKAREAEDWKVDNNLVESMKKYNVETQFSKDGKQFIKDLTPFWIENKPNPYKNLERFKGTVKTILPNGKSGFISSKSSSDNYYFNFGDINFESSKVSEGLEVDFCLTTRYDKKKNRESQCAVDIFLAS